MIYYHQIHVEDVLDGLEKCGFGVLFVEGRHVATHLLVPGGLVPPCKDRIREFGYASYLNSSYKHWTELPLVTYSACTLANGFRFSTVESNYNIVPDEIVELEYHHCQRMLTIQQVIDRDIWYTSNEIVEHYISTGVWGQWIPRTLEAACNNGMNYFLYAAEHFYGDHFSRRLGIRREIYGAS